jgi:hypothetical protein
LRIQKAQQRQTVLRNKHGHGEGKMGKQRKRLITTASSNGLTAHMTKNRSRKNDCLKKRLKQRKRIALFRMAPAAQITGSFNQSTINAMLGKSNSLAD